MPTLILSTTELYKKYLSWQNTAHFRNQFNTSMTFNIEKLFNFCVEEINNFAKNHQNELFYAFAIDASLLCLNSEEEFSVSLKRYRDEWEYDNRSISTWEELSGDDLSLLRMRAEYLVLDLEDHNACLSIINQDRSENRLEGNPYHKDDEIISLRESTGDWRYQGFGRMTESVGFDEDAYSLHYGLSDEKQKTSMYGKAMDKLLKRLVTANAFAYLRLSPDFSAIRVEHNY